jgi:hypothetical protein
MEDLEAQFQAAVSAVDIAGAVIVGSDAKSKPRNYQFKAKFMLPFAHKSQASSTMPMHLESVLSRRVTLRHAYH